MTLASELSFVRYLTPDGRLLFTTHLAQLFADGRLRFEI